MTILSDGSRAPPNPEDIRRRAIDAAKHIRALQEKQPDYSLIGLRGVHPEAIDFMRADDLLSILDWVASGPIGGSVTREAKVKP